MTRVVGAAGSWPLCNEIEIPVLRGELQGNPVGAISVAIVDLADHAIVPGSLGGPRVALTTTGGNVTLTAVLTRDDLASLFESAVAAQESIDRELAQPGAPATGGLQ